MQSIVQLQILVCLPNMDGSHFDTIATIAKIWELPVK